MLRLRKGVLSHLLSAGPSPSTSPLLSLHRLLSTAAPAPAVSPSTGFAVEEYLVSTCGLTRAQALKASAKLSHLKSPANPDAVLAFLIGLGLSGADAAAVVARDPQFLCAGVKTTLSPVVAGLTGLGLSRSEIARLVSLAPGNFRNRSVVSKLEYYLPLLGSIDNLLRPLKHGSGFLDSDLERVVKPNVNLLSDCGLGACDIAKLFIQMPRIISASPEHVRWMVVCAERIGVPRGSRMFRHALHAVSCLSEDKIAAKLDYLKKTLRWSDTEVGIAVSKGPFLLRRSNDVLQRVSEFLVCEVGLQPAYIAHGRVCSVTAWRAGSGPGTMLWSSLMKMDCSSGTRATIQLLNGLRKISWRSSYALTRTLHHTLLKTMQPLAQGRCLLDSDLHEPRTG